jgi:hypothetical protein
MYKFINVLLIAYLIIFFVSKLSAQDPNPTSVVGTINHGASITIYGTNFGIKSPAAPLIWDDCEGKTINNDAAVLSSGWNDPWPRVYVSSDSTKTRYKPTGFRSVPQPHQYSSQILGGCHYQDQDNNPQYIGDGAEGFRAVGVNIDATVQSDRWYVRFYYRLDPKWNRQEMNNNNHKVTVFQWGPNAYDPGRGFQYTVFENGATGRSPGVQSTHNCALEPSSDIFNNPRLKWIIWEETLDTQTLEREIIVDGDSANLPLGYYTADGVNTARSFTMGGYYRRVRDGGSINNPADYRGGWEGGDGSMPDSVDTNWRYFDDAYVDTTWARVILGNASTYSACTIIEPQIPTSWSSTSIVVTINLGAIPSEVPSYIYVFNGDNDHNSNGLEFTPGIPPTPTNKVLKIIDIQ